MIVNIIASFITAFMLSVVMSALMIDINLVDIPNSRSSHKVPVARAGGMGIFLAFLMTIVIFDLYPGGEIYQKLMFTAILCGMVLCAALGIIDDVRSIPAWLRLPLQIIIATYTIYLMNMISIDSIKFDFEHIFCLKALSYVLGVLWLVGYINVFNFMDGINGISGGTAIIHLIFIALLAHQQQNDLLVYTLIILVFACLGFLIFNFPKAQLFLGDSGSYLLGISIAMFSLQIFSHRSLISSILLILMLHFMYLFDTSLTLVKRFYRGKNIFTAHREHLYQVLQNSGWSHAKVSSLYWGFAVLQGCLVYLCQDQSWILQIFILMLMFATAGFLRFLYIFKISKKILYNHEHFDSSGSYMLSNIKKKYFG